MKFGKISSGIVILAAFIFALNSCKSDGNGPSGASVSVNAMEEVAVPAGFDYNMFQMARVVINTSGQQSDQRYSVSIYTSAAAMGLDQPAQQVFVKGNELQEVNMQLPKALTDLYVISTDPFGKQTTQRVVLNSGRGVVNLSKGDYNNQNPNSGAMKTAQAHTGTGLDCSTGCGTVITDFSTLGWSYPHTLPTGTVCLVGTATDSIIPGHLIVPAGCTLRICGPVRVTSLVQNFGDVIVTDGARFQTYGFQGVNGSLWIDPQGLFKPNANNGYSGYYSYWQHADVVVNLGTIKGGYNSFHGASDTLYNYGTITGTNSINIAYSTYVINEGTMQTQTFAFSGSRFINNNKVTASGFDLSSTGPFENNDTLIAASLTNRYGGYLLNNAYASLNYMGSHGGGIIENNAYIKVLYSVNNYLPRMNYRLNGGSFMDVGQSATFGYGYLLENTTSGTALLRTGLDFGRPNPGGQDTIRGDVTVCVGRDSLNIYNSYTVLSPAQVITDCSSIYIPATTYNPGLGTPPVPVDTDGDGIADTADAFPNDPALAGLLVGDKYTFAAEDTWPWKGDYDFNDLSAVYHYVAYTNAANEVVSMKIPYQFRSRGALSANGFGMILGVDPTGVTVTGYNHTQGYVTVGANGAETGETQRTSMVFQDLNNNKLAPFNTRPNQPFTIDEWDTVYVSFTSPQATAVLATLDPFLIAEQNRGEEIHATNLEPTALVDTAKFDYGLDASDPGNGAYYIDVNNHPWAIIVPGVWKHPTEQTDINQAYLNFANWASSAGAQNADWYVDTIPANINDQKIMNR